jgi:hypothetical protein
MDFILGFSLSEGKDAIFVVVDLSTKHAHFIPLTPKFTTSEIARFFGAFYNVVWMRCVTSMCNAYKLK